ncbi:MAG TPA: Rossmann-like and DUF2520 domain-containing protein [Bacteroidota bacterium]|nr:Rossmann-like and DUF2520 domain-containing protein [Bacteroidota bacterium]
MNPSSVTVIGAGAVGSALALALRKQSYPIDRIISRSRASASALARRLRLKTWGTLDSFTLPKGGVLIFALPDDALAGVAAQIAGASQSSIASAATIVLHTSGALPSDVLSPLRDACGAHIGSFHPLMLFPKGRSSGREFTGCPVALEGDVKAIAGARRLARALKARPFLVPAEKKVLYHIAAVFASNYFVTLLSAVEKTAGLSIDAPREDRMALFEPLIRQTLEAVLRSRTSGDALTGPIARDDRETVRRHLEALKRLDDNDLLSLYIELGLATAHLAKKAFE